MSTINFLKKNNLLIFNGWNTKWKYFFLSFKSPIFGVCIRFKQKSHCQESHNSFDRSMFSTDMYRAIIFSTCHCFFLPSLLFQQNHCQNYLFFFFFFYLLYFSNTIATITIFFFLFPLSYFSKTIAKIIIFFFLSSLFWQHLWRNNNLFFFFFFLSPISTKPSRITLFFYPLLFWQHHCHNYNFFFSPLPYFGKSIAIFSYFGNTIATITIYFFFLSCLLFWQHHCHFYFFSLIHFRSRAIYFQSWGKKWAAISSIFGHGQSFFGHRKGKKWVAIVALRMPNLFFSLLSPL